MHAFMHAFIHRYVHTYLHRHIHTLFIYCLLCTYAAPLVTFIWDCIVPLLFKQNKTHGWIFVHQFSGALLTVDGGSASPKAYLDNAWRMGRDGSWRTFASSFTLLSWLGSHQKIQETALNAFRFRVFGGVHNQSYEWQTYFLENWCNPHVVSHIVL